MKLDFFKNRHNFMLIVLFVLLAVSALIIGNKFKYDKIHQLNSKQQNIIANLISNEVRTLILEKKNATLAIALSYAQTIDLKKFLLNDYHDDNVFKNLSLKLRNETDFKNVWFQLVDKEGISQARSWSDKQGDDLTFREDARSMLAKPRVKTSISVGRFDMTFKSMVPIYDTNTDKNMFIGFLEVITHFNSIAKKIKNKGIEPVILVNKKYKNRLKYPFTKKFMGDYYIANLNADNKLLEHITVKGLEYFISPHSHFIIDKTTSSIVINYALFDSEQELMANFLMFKPLNTFDIQSTENLTIRVNLLILLFVLSSGFSLYFFSDKEQLTKQVVNRSYISLFVLIFLFVSISYFLLFYWNFQNKRENYLESHSIEMNNDYLTLYKHFTEKAETMFYTSINTPEVLNLFAKAYTDDKNEIRKKLYSLLLDEYQFFKKYNINLLHFHLKNNESFIRFHKPEKFGDNLTGIRETIDWVNRNRRKIDGFENGRVYSNFRNVFPLIVTSSSGEKQYIGSVEISFNVDVIINEYIAIHHAKVGFLVKKDVVDRKLFAEERTNYLQSGFAGYYFNRAIKKQFEQKLSRVDLSLLENGQLHDISVRINKGKTFTVISLDGEHLYTFIPIKNAVTKKVVATIILQHIDRVLPGQFNLFLISSFTGFIAILFVFLYIYREFIARKKFQQISYIKSERVKELQCMYNVTEVIRSRTALKVMLQRIAKIIPDSWFYPEKTRAAIIFDDQTYYSESFETVLKKYSSNIIVRGENRGKIEIYAIKALHQNEEPDVVVEKTKLIDGIAQNIGEYLELKKAEDQLRTLSQAIEQSPVSVVITDTNARIEYVNHSFERITGYSSDDVIGNNPRILSSGNTSKKAYQDLWQTISHGEAWQGELQNRKKNGDVFWEHVYIAPVQNESGETYHYMAVKEDITLRKEQEEQILYQAHYDHLTKLPNRFLALDRLKRFIIDAGRNDEKVAVLFIDLDNFKKINDTLGHESGDKLLVEATERLSRIVRSGDTVGRLGGDEFIVLLSGQSNVNNASIVAGNLLESFRDVFIVDGRELILTASIGIAVYPENGDTPSELLRSADSAMYYSKKSGRNTCSFYTEAMNREISRQFELEAQMHGALERGEFEIYYQPKIDIQTRKIMGVEALLRWHNPILGQISPEEFIPVAEQTGMILAIGEFVFFESLMMTAQWLKMYKDNFTIAINLSPRQFHDANLLPFIKESIRQSNVPNHLIELEITEGVLLSKNSIIDDTLSAFSELGLGIAMDDFGTGYSSLSYLRSYPFNVLKIDRSFVNDICADQADRELIIASISMAHGLGLKVVAEGVETEEQFAFLAEQGCEYAQGYLFSKPVTADVITKMLEAI